MKLLLDGFYVLSRLKTTTDFITSMWSILKHYFKEKPSLEDYIAAHEPTDMAHVEYLEKQYARITYDKNFWGISI